MVLSDGMVHFLKIEKICNKSTQTILWLERDCGVVAYTLSFWQEPHKYYSKICYHSLRVWWCIKRITRCFFLASCHLTLTARINLSNTLIERKTPRHKYSKATSRKTNEIVNIDVWTHPSRIFSTFGRSKSQCNYGHIGFACKLQLKRSTVNHVKDTNFSVCKRHSLCIGDATFPKIYSMWDCTANSSSICE